jgi:chromosomal replication initiation ATPase DnaA
MKFLIEIDLEKLGTNEETRIVNRTLLTKKDIIFFICKYFNITYKDLRTLPLKRNQEYVMARKLITYFLHINFEPERYEICRYLGYSTNYDSLNIISSNLKTLSDLLDAKDEQYTRSFNNIKRLLDKLANK